MKSGSQILEDLELFERLGAGGMGEVFRARQISLDREVALKISNWTESPSPDAVMRFRREVEVQMRLKHPNLVEVFSAGEHEGQSFLVMELVDGPTLQEFLRTRAPLVPDLALPIMRDLSDAVAHLHAEGIVHRDLKPGNVLLRSDGRVKLADFGLAKDLDRTDMTRSNQLLGTLHYLAPELVAGEPAAPPSDVYALGLILYEMLTGSLPFRAQNPAEWLHLIANAVPPPPSERNPAVPRAVSDAVLAMLERDPGRRPSAAQVAERLEALRAPAAGGITASLATALAQYRAEYGSAVTAKFPRDADRSRRAALKWPVVWLLVACLAGAAAFAFRRAQLGRGEFHAPPGGFRVEVRADPASAELEARLVPAVEPADLPRVLETVRELAGRGQPAARLVQAYLLATGQGVPRDPAAGVALVEAAVRERDPRAPVLLAWIVEHDPRRPPSADALALYRSAAEGGNRVAQLHLGQRLAARSDPADAAAGRAWIRKAAEQGEACAQLWMARNDRDPATALAWLEKAAGQGLVAAQLLLGAKYRDGDGVPRDREQARDWFVRAGRHGDPEAVRALDALGP